MDAGLQSRASGTVDPSASGALDLLRRLMELRLGVSASSMATLSVLQAVEGAPLAPTAVFTLLRPLSPLLARADVAINVPLLHGLVADGLLETCAAGSLQGGPGRLYGLTPAGRRRLGELRVLVRDAGQQTLAAAAADLAALFSA